MLGIGKYNIKIFWITLLIFHLFRSSTNLNEGLYKRKGKILIAVNEWLTFYNVRVNQINLITGREILLKIKPTQHTASDSVKALSVKSRNCRLTTENHVSFDVTLRTALQDFNFSNGNSCRYQTVCSPYTNRRGVCLNARSDLLPIWLAAHHGIFLSLLSFHLWDSATIKTFLSSTNSLTTPFHNRHVIAHLIAKKSHLKLKYF